MKEDINIDELFKSKFENFEGNVDPSAWANISQGIGAAGAGSGAGAVGGGLSGLSKVAIIVGAAAVTTFGVWYFTNDSDTEKTSDNLTLVDEEVNPTVTNEETTPINVEDNYVTHDEDVAVEAEENANVEENNGTNLNEGENENSSNESNTGNTEESSNGNTEDTTNLSGDNSGNGNEEETTNTGNSNEEGQTQDKPETVKPKANPEFEVNGNEVTFVSNASDHKSVSWNFGDGTAESRDNATHTYKKPGTYKVEVMVSGKGATLKKTLEVTIEGTSAITKIPTVFTPSDRDNRNDYFFIESEGLSQFKIIIYDANMNPVFTSEDPNFEWNGEGNDGTVKVGRYQFVIAAQGEDGQTFQRAGSLTVK